MVKIDIRKTYDSVAWNFLQMVLLEFGFLVKMVNLIMTCFNCKLCLVDQWRVDYQIPSRKRAQARQPMSPYLFVLAMEYLNRTLKKLNANPDLTIIRDIQSSI